MKRYTIQDFSDRCGVSAARLRHYEKLGIIQPQRDQQNRYRFYTDQNLLDIQRIGMLQSIGVPLGQMKFQEHADAPSLFRRQVQDRITDLRDQIDRLNTQLKMMMDIEMRLPEMETDHCREWFSLPYYALYYDECQDPSLMANWMGLMPYVLSFSSISMDQLLGGASPLHARLGLAIVEKHLYSLPLRIEPPVLHIDGFSGIRCIVKLRDALNPSREEFQQIFDFLKRTNQRIAGDMLLGVRGSDADENGPFYYTRILLPTETR